MIDANVRLQLSRLDAVYVVMHGELLEKVKQKVAGYPVGHPKRSEGEDVIAMYSGPSPISRLLAAHDELEARVAALTADRDELAAEIERRDSHAEDRRFN